MVRRTSWKEWVSGDVVGDRGVSTEGKEKNKYNAGVVLRRLPMVMYRSLLSSLSVVLSIIIMSQGLLFSPQLAVSPSSPSRMDISSQSLSSNPGIPAGQSLSSTVSSVVKALSSKLPPASDPSARKPALLEASKLATDLPNLGGTDPSGWSSSSIPSSASSITDTSCSGSLCMATGAGTTGSLDDLFVSVDEGLTWTASSISGNPQTLAVSCASSSTCYVLGTVSTNSTPTTQLYVTTNAGSTWSQVQVASGVLTSQLLPSLPVQLDCPSATECALFATGSTGYVLDLTTDGGAAWSSVGLPSGIYPTGLSCPDTSNCMVSGAVLNSGTGSAPLPAVVSVTNLTGSPVVSSDTSFTLPAESTATVDTNLWPLNLLVGGPFSAPISATASTISTSYLTGISCPSTQTCYAMGEGTYGVTMSLAPAGFGDTPVSFDVPGITLLVSSDGGITWSYDADIASELANQAPQAFIGIIESAFFYSLEQTGGSTSSSALNMFSYGALASQAFIGIAGTPGSIRCVTSSDCYVVTLPNPDAFGTQSSSSGMPQVLASTILATNDAGTTFKVQSSLEEINPGNTSSPPVYYDNGVPVGSLPSFPSSLLSISCVNASSCVVGGTDSGEPSIYATTSSGWTSPALYGSFPSQASLQGTTVSDMVGSGLDGPSSSVKVGSNSAEEIGCVSENICSIDVPGSSSPGSVDISLSTLLGTGNLPDAISYIVPPSVSSITPSSGSIDGGTYVTITGTNFQPNTGTIFSFGGVYASGFSSSCSSSTTCVLYGTPQGKSLGSVDVQALTLGGISPASSAISFDYIGLPPEVYSVSPDAGAISGGETVDIGGSYLVGATAVSFGTIPAASFSVISGTVIEAVAPADSAATSSSSVTVNITVTTPSGTSAVNSNDQFTYEGPPSIASIALSSSSNMVDITGENLTGTASVSFNGTSSTYVQQIAYNEIQAIVPSSVGGTVDVTVTTPSGTSSPYSFSFPAPTVSQVTPDVSGTSGGGTVNIYGNWLNGTTAVYFGSTEATSFSIISGTEISVVAPAEQSGTVDVTVTTPSGTSPVNSNDQFTYEGLPTITSVSLPSCYYYYCNSVVQITGENLTATASVSFDGVASSDFWPVSPGIIDATVPSTTGGTLSITVSTPAGTSSPYSFSLPAPTVSQVTPDVSGTSGGETVSIYGNWLNGTTAVDFGSTEATSFSIISPTEISAVAPAEQAGTVNITVTTPSGTSAVNSNDQFTYEGPPTITSAEASSSGTVLIFGSNLLGAYEVTFDGEYYQYYIQADTSTELVTVLPSGLSGQISVSVTTPVGTSPLGYMGGPPPQVSQVTPDASGTSGGETVDIYGNYFNGTTAVYFGSTEATSFSVISGTEVEAVAPAEQSGTVDVTVTTPSGTSPSTSSDQFTYEPPPTITSIAAPSGTSTTVTIDGDNFTGATSVSFNGTSVTPDVISPSEIQAPLPSGIVGTIGTVVTTPAGSSSPQGATPPSFTYYPAPILSCISPTSGYSVGGTDVTLTGSNFQYATSVYFGSTQAVEFQVVSSGEITAITPAHIPSTVTVVVKNALGQGSSQYGCQYTYPTPSPSNTPPAITGASYGGIGSSINSLPTSSFCAGETPIIITGAGFSSVTQVYFGSVPATDFADINGQLVVCPPLLSSATYTITIDTPQGPATVTFTYLPEPPPPPPSPPSPPSRPPVGGPNPPHHHIHQCNKGAGGYVDCATGDFWEQETDFSIPGFNGGLQLTRTYDSGQAGKLGPFGAGWFFNYGISLTSTAQTVSVEEGNTGTYVPQTMYYATVTFSNGSELTFSSSGQYGTYSGSPGMRATLQANPDGSWTMVEDGQETLSFSANGQLNSMSDINGETTTFGYNSSGRLVKVTDSSGKSLSFTYDSRGFITKVVDPMGRSTLYDYNSNGQLTKVTLPDGSTYSYGYDTQGQMTSLTDPLGGVVTNSYNSKGQVISQINPLGEKTTWSYENLSNCSVMVSVGSSQGVQAYQSGGGGMALGGTCDSGPYSAAGSITTITGPTGIEEQQVYRYGTLISVTKDYGGPRAATWRYQVDPSSDEVLAAEGPDGRVTKFTYDAAGNVTSVTDPSGNTTTTTWNAFDEPLSTTNALGVSSTRTYNSHGDLISISQPVTATLTSTATYSYANPSHLGEVTSFISPNGSVTKYSYNSSGQVTSVTTPNGSTTTYTYNADGQITSMTSPRGNLKAANASAYTTTYSYNSAGELISVSGPLGTTSYVYDPGGLLSSETAPDGSVTAYSYDLGGHLTSTTSAYGTTNAATTTYSYGPRGNMISDTNPLGETTSYVYGPLGNLDSVTNPLGETTTYKYHKDGLLLSTTEPDGTLVDSSYNKDAELASISYPGTSITPTTYSYSPTGDVTSVSGPTGTQSFTYDLADMVTSTTGVDGNMSYVYNSSLEPTSITYPNGKTVTRSYNPEGQLSSVTDWNNNTTSYSYGPDGNLDTETLPNGITGSFSYDPASELSSISYTKGCSTKASPSVPPAPPAQCTTLYSRNYTYQPGGLVSSSSSTQPSPPSPSSPSSQSYTYNPLQELTSVTSGSANPTSPSSGGPASTQGVDSYTYDLAGNLSGVSNANDLYSLGYNAASELSIMNLSKLQPQTPPGAVNPSPQPSLSAEFTYNTNGERVGESITSPAPAQPPTPPAGPQPPTTAGVPQPPTVATMSYGYDTEGQMTSYKGPSGGSPLSIGSSGTATNSPSIQMQETYGYGPEGQLITSSASTLTPTGPNPIPPASSASSTTSFSWNTASSIPEMIGVNGYYYIYVEGLPIEQIAPDGTILYYLHNRQGSTVALTDQQGNIIASYSYSPYGTLTCDTATSNQPASSCTGSSGIPPTPPQAQCGPVNQPTPPPTPPGGTQSSTTCLSRAIEANHFLYDGQYLDTTSGLYYLRARWYDPATGQFTSVDALVAITGEPYSYAGGNPVNGGDPLGLFHQDMPNVNVQKCNSDQSYYGANQVGCNIVMKQQRLCSGIANSLAANSNVYGQSGIPNSADALCQSYPTVIHAYNKEHPAPSYIQVCLSSAYVEGCLSAANGNVYLSVGLGDGLGSSPLSLQIGFTNGPACKLLSGSSMSAGGQYGVGGGYAWSPSTGSRGPYMSFGTPGIGAYGTYGWKIFGNSPCC